ncbi:hypothetical protein LUTEI9C_60007 [Luteimonas sp. 9C]|nr:hypothetical protein LUTEI9C_60007 [Luteimonas sp. 9C]
MGAVPRQARRGGHRRGFTASARVRRRDLLVPFGSIQKGLARAAGESSALAPASSLVARRFATLIFWTKQWINRRSEDQRQGFRAVARLTFVLAKISKTVFAGRDPPRYGRGGPLRFSDDGARSPNSLRSDMGCSSTPSPCDARLALRLDSGQEQIKSKSRANPKQKQKPRPKPKQNIRFPSPTACTGQHRSTRKNPAEAGFF